VTAQVEPDEDWEEYDTEQVASCTSDEEVPDLIPKEEPEEASKENMRPAKRKRVE
jgi:hypothetical protein